MIYAPPAPIYQAFQINFRSALPTVAIYVSNVAISVSIIFSSEIFNLRDP